MARAASFSRDRVRYAYFDHAMQDERLGDPMVLLGDLQEFVESGRKPQRIFLR